MATTSQQNNSPLLWTLRLLIPLLILGGGYYGYEKLIESRDKPKRKPRPVQLQVVEAQTLQLTDYQIQLNSQGTVRPAAEAELSAEVSGRVVWVSEDFREGKIVAQGTELVRLESADYQTQVILAQSELARVQATLEEEQARAERALSEWKRVRGNTPPPPLAIRQPQLKQAQAAVQAAQASLDQAKRDLKRTSIRAPWDGFVRTQEVDIGQFVNRGAIVGELLQADQSEVWLPLTQRQLALLDQTTIGGNNPLKVQLRSQEQGLAQEIQGLAMRLSAELDAETRQQYLIVEVSHELPHLADTGEVDQEIAKIQSPLRVNAFVEASFEGITLEDVFVLDPIAVREGLSSDSPLPPGSSPGKLYLIDEIKDLEEPSQGKPSPEQAEKTEQAEEPKKQQGKLYSREVAILWRTPDEVVVSPLNPEALQEGQLISVTNLQRIPEGQAVRIRMKQETASEAD